jgi:hypothetical protein
MFTDEQWEVAVSCQAEMGTQQRLDLFAGKPFAGGSVFSEPGERGSQQKLAAWGEQTRKLAEKLPGEW